MLFETVTARTFLPCHQAPARITMLAGVPFSSYVTLSGRHTLHGHVTILENVSAAGLLAVSVDGVHITRKSVLTSNEYQYLKGNASCQTLLAAQHWPSTLQEATET